jgi:hypothetical protein
MKKLMITTALVIGLGMCAFADNGGLFERGKVSDDSYYGMGHPRDGIYYTPILPYHELDTNQPADIVLPLTDGLAVLLGLGAAYWVGKKRKEE